MSNVIYFIVIYLVKLFYISDLVFYVLTVSEMHYPMLSASHFLIFQIIITFVYRPRDYM